MMRRMTPGKSVELIEGVSVSVLSQLGEIVRAYSLLELAFQHRSRKVTPDQDNPRCAHPWTSRWTGNV